MNYNTVKRQIVLSPRLEAALGMLPATPSAVADIGCDHGRLSAAILQRGIASRVIASDISPASLDKAHRLAQLFGMEDRIECRVSDGFSAYSKGEIDSAVIAGMGGELICAILREHENIVRGLSRIVMQPMRGESELREYLYKNRYRTIDERVIFDGGRYYQLISARSDIPQEPPSDWPEDFWQFGFIGLQKRDPCLLELMHRYLDILSRKLARAAEKGSSPEWLVHEADCTCRLIAMYDAPSRTGRTNTN